MTDPPVSGSRLELRIDTINSEGAGVGRTPEGQVVFVPRTAPGDLVVVEIDEVRRRWLRARLLLLREPGPERCDAPCPYYAACGGCALQHMAYSAQLSLKGRIVRDALQRIGDLGQLPAPRMHAASRPTRYRNRLTLTLLRSAGGEVRAGFHGLERPGEILDVDARCILPEAPIAAAWSGLRRSWGAGAARMPSGRRLRLTLRAAVGGEVMLLIEGGTGEGDPSFLQSRVPGLASIWHRPGDGKGPPRLLAGRETLPDLWDGEEIEVGPRAFLQPNRSGARELYREVVRLAEEPAGKRIVDAYCGYGGLGRRFARSGAQVVGIEADPEVVRMAETRPVEGFRVLMGRVEERLPEALPADLVIMNPPRTGAHENVMDQLGESRPGQIIYVSCNPATLARDVRRLDGSYRVVSLHGFDLFPQTSTVETVLVLQPA